MPEYIRWREAGGSYFFTVVTAGRRSRLATEDAVAVLRRALSETRTAHPFHIDAAVVLPDHLHMIWTLPPGDNDFSTRWRLIKSQFTRLYLARGGSESSRTAARAARGERAVWQRRYWEHRIRDASDFRRHADYIHFNPVKHGLTACPHAWRWSSFARWVERGWLAADWACGCLRSAGDRTTKVRVADIPGCE